MKSLIYLTLIFALATAQVFNWSGHWDVWDVVPRNHTIHISQCCAPSKVKISQNACNPFLIDVKFDFTNVKKACPVLKEEIEINEMIINGQFIDLKRHSHMRGVYGLYRPNNDTILIDPGFSGNCIWILGSKKSIKTNTTDANNAINWAGSWKIDEMYPAVPDGTCCRPDEPLHIKQDRKTNTISYDLHYDSKRKNCDISTNETIHLNVSIFGGGFTHRHVRGFFLRNQSILVESGECVTIWSKKREDDSILTKNSNIMIAISEEITRNVEIPEVSEEAFATEMLLDSVFNLETVENSDVKLDQDIIKSIMNEITKLPNSDSESYILKSLKELMDPKASKFKVNPEIYSKNQMIHSEENKDLENSESMIKLKDIKDTKLRSALEILDLLSDNYSNENNEEEGETSEISIYQKMMKIESEATTQPIEVSDDAITKTGGNILEESNKSKEEDNSNTLLKSTAEEIIRLSELKENDEKNLWKKIIDNVIEAMHLPNRN